MVTTPQTAVPQAPADAARKLLIEVGPFAESLSKAAATLAVVVYLCGFLTVSLHHSSYGFIGTNPFRPRILAAGAWFIFLVAIPVAMATRYKERSAISIVSSLAFVLLVFYGLGNVLVSMLFDLGNDPVGPHFKGWMFWAWGVAVLVTGMLYASATRSKKATPTLLAATSGAFVLLMIGMRLHGYLQMRDFESRDLALWFFGIFVITLLELKTNPGNYSGDRIKGLGTDLFLIFAVLFVFGHHYYPHIKSAWGGGTPVDVTIYFTKDSVVKPGQFVSARLVEESDEGFYIVGQGETTALYIPRNAVALVYFSSNTVNSRLLPQENK